MIFATMGTQIPFDRFLRMLDQVAPLLKGEQIIAQTIPGHYKPTNFETVGLIGTELFTRYIESARIIVSHAGMGTIINALTARKPIVVVPRMASLGEHRNEHQLATARRLGEMGFVHVANDATQLLDALTTDSLQKLRTIADTAPASMVRAISGALDKN